MNRVKRNLKMELDDSTREFKRQLADMDMQISRLRQHEAELKEERFEVTQEHEKLRNKLELAQERYFSKCINSS